ncbi:hypothetical protein [Amphritea japonica]|uniref:hypothetical protein n=1 Tax=Amphritea japonica TaxID=452627 RepID=UPI00035CB0A4|nr:hypothetical protein [Amphritea japonica]
MINADILDLKELLHGFNTEGDPEPSFVKALAQYRGETIDKTLTAEVFLKGEFPAIFSVFIIIVKACLPAIRWRKP